MRTINLAKLGWAGHEGLSKSNSILLYMCSLNTSQPTLHCFSDIFEVILKTTATHEATYVTQVSELEYLPLYCIGAPKVAPQFRQMRAVNASVGGVSNTISAMLAHRYTSSIDAVLMEMNNLTRWSARANMLASCSFVLRRNVLFEAPQEYLLQEVEGIINDVSAIGTIMSIRTSKWGSRGTYGEILTNLTTRYGRSLFPFSFKVGVYHVGFGIIVDFKNRRVLGVTTLKKKYLEYYQLKRNVEAESTTGMAPGVLKILVDEKFREEESGHPPQLYSLFEKGIIEPFKRQGIETEFVDGNTLFEQFFSTQVNGPESILGPIEQIAENETIQDSMMHDVTVEDTLQEENILIIN